MSSIVSADTFGCLVISAANRCETVHDASATGYLIEEQDKNDLA